MPGRLDTWMPAGLIRAPNASSPLASSPLSFELSDAFCPKRRFTTTIDLRGAFSQGRLGELLGLREEVSLGHHCSFLFGLEFTGNQ